MKDQATHIRLIRDDNGKPVEAEYLRTREIPSFLNAFQLLNAQRIRRNFTEWSIANRIPVTGDWPTDKDVFAMDEVEPVSKCIVDGCDSECGNHILFGCDNIKSHLRLKAKQESEEDRLNRFIESHQEAKRRLKATLSDDRQSEEEHIVPLMPRKTIPVKLTVQSEVTVKEGEQPKQEAKTAPILSEAFADNGGHSHWRLIDPDSGELLWTSFPEEDAILYTGYKPKQEANTAESWTYRYLLFDTTKMNAAQIRNLSEEPYCLKDDEIDAVYEECKNDAKQQYQQELIEKLEEERQYRSVPDQYVIDSIIEIIQSTK